MRFISSKVHGILDYLVGVLLIISPWLFGFSDIFGAKWVPIVLGLGALMYSLLTRYELGVFRLIPFKVHLGMDMVSGLVLMVSPWFFGFDEYVRWPHVILGLTEIIVPMLTRPYSSIEDVHTHTHAQHQYEPVYRENSPAH